MSRPGVRRLAAVAVVTAVLAACSSGGSSGTSGRDPEPAPSTTVAPDDVPEYAGPEAVPPYTGDEAHSVLVIGDSIAQTTAPFLQLRMAQAGLAGGVVNEGHSGSMIVGRPGIDWQAELPGLLDRHQPDIVVAHFAGHGDVPGTEVGTPEWYAAVRQATLATVDEILGRGIALYWVLPPVESWPGSEVDGQVPFPPEVFRAAADWYRDELVVERPEIHLVDWRTVLSPGEEWVESMRFPDGRVLPVRVDEAHLSVWGATIAADLTTAAIRPEWG